MIITKLTGGLGNQMFQYAMGRRTAISNETKLKLDTKWYEEISNDDTKREYGLGVFNIDETFATDKEIYRYRENKIERLFNKFKPYYKKTLIKEYNKFDPNFLRIGKRAYLVGNWQSAEYFKDIRDIIISDFKLKKPMSEKAAKIADRIRQTNAVSMHIRRSDYVNNPRYKKTYEELDSKYYKDAISIIKQKLTNLEIFVFSDDIEWAKQNLSFEYPTTYIIGDGMRDFEEMILMSKCKHNIIANSSFSWWGAWLNTNPEKIVIAPKKWFRSNSGQTSISIIPPSWKIL